MNNPELIKKAIALSASGKSQAEIADEVDSSQPTICRLQKKYNKEIEREAEKYLALLPDLVHQDETDFKTASQLSNHISDPQQNKNLTAIKETKDQIRFLEYADKKATDIKRSIGLYSSQAPALIFQQMNIYHEGDKLLINPQILGLIRAKVDEFSEEEVEGEVEE